MPYMYQSQQLFRHFKLENVYSRFCLDISSLSLFCPIWLLWVTTELTRTNSVRSARQVDDVEIGIRRPFLLFLLETSQDM